MSAAANNLLEDMRLEDPAFCQRPTIQISQNLPADGDTELPDQQDGFRAGKPGR